MKSLHNEIHNTANDIRSHIIYTLFPEQEQHILFYINFRHTKLVKITNLLKLVTKQ